MERCIVILVVVLFSLVCSTVSRRNDKVGKSSKKEESINLRPNELGAATELALTLLNGYYVYFQCEHRGAQVHIRRYIDKCPLEAATVVARGRQLLHLNTTKIGGPGCEQVQCKSNQLCVSRSESAMVACVRKKLLFSRSGRSRHKLQSFWEKLGAKLAKPGGIQSEDVKRKVSRMKKQARQFERDHGRKQRKRLATLYAENQLYGENPPIPTEQLVSSSGDSSASAVASLNKESTAVCRQKQLKGLGRRLVDQFKQKYDEQKKRRKEKRNSTKKELREDDECTCQSTVSWQFQQLDADYDAHLNKAELEPIKLQSDRTEMACIDRFMATCDHDHDGMLSEKEWCCCFADVVPPCMAALTLVPSLLIRGEPSLAPGAMVPQCDDDGFFRPLQCHGSTGQCWCVDRNGQKLGAKPDGSLDC